MAHLIREVIVEAVRRDDYAMLSDLSRFLVFEQVALMPLALQTPRIMCDVRLINAYKPCKLTSERRKTLLSLSALVGKFEVLTNAFSAPLLTDSELLLELLDSAQIGVQQKIVLLAKAKHAFYAKQIHVARVLTSWLIEHSIVSDIDLCNIFEASINNDKGDEWLFRKMLGTGALISVLRKAKKGEALITPQLLGMLNSQPDEVKYRVITRALGKRRD